MQGKELNVLWNEAINIKIRYWAIFETKQQPFWHNGSTFSKKIGKLRPYLEGPGAGPKAYFIEEFSDYFNTCMEKKTVEYASIFLRGLLLVYGLNS